MSRHADIPDRRCRRLVSAPRLSPSPDHFSPMKMRRWFGNVSEESKQRIIDLLTVCIILAVFLACFHWL
jgi:hypothetical protein